MQAKVNDNDSDYLNRETQEELADVLTAISVVSKRLARKLILMQQSKQEKKGVKTGEQDE